MAKFSKIAIFLLAIIMFETSCVLKWGVDYLKEASNRCDSIEDIYYYPSSTYNERYFIATQKCPYTLNVCEKPCHTVYIKRKFYSSYKEEYEDLGLPFPFPKKKGKDGLVYPEV